MPRILTLFALALFTACGGGGGDGDSSPPAQATTTYVREDGNDGNDGLTPDRAFRTLERAVDNLTAGDVVYVGPGLYGNPPRAPGEPQPTQSAHIDEAIGTEAQPIRLIADVSGEKTGVSPGPVYIDGEDAAIGLRISRSSHVIVDGFFIERGRGDNGAGVQIRGGSSNITIRNCIITNNGDGIRVDASTDPLLFNNLIYDNTNRGIRINGTQRARIINNTIVNNNNRGVAIGGANGQLVGSINTTLRNNLIQNNNNVSISVEDEPSSLEGYIGNYNVVYYEGLADQSKTYRPTTIVGDHDVNADALITDPDNGIFTLLPGSPAIDAGTGNIEDALLSALFDRTTSPDGTLDAPPVDIGYHALP
jgi:parallel beta-helix repeat protein